VQPYADILTAHLKLLKLSAHQCRYRLAYVVRPDNNSKYPLLKGEIKKTNAKEPSHNPENSCKTMLFYPNFFHPIY